MSNPVRTRPTGREASGNARRPGTANSKKCFASDDSKLPTKTGTICLKQLKVAFSEMRLAIAATEQKRFYTYFHQLEVEVRSATMNTYPIVVQKLTQLQNFLSPMRDKPPVEQFLTLLLKLRRCLDKGNNEFDPLKYVIGGQKEEPVEESRQEQFADAAEEAVREKEMMQLNEEIQNLLDEINNPKPQTKWSREPEGRFPLDVRQARKVLSDRKRTTESTEKEMKQLNEEIKNLLDEINNPKPQTKWSRKPEGGLPLSVWQARKVLSDEKSTTQSYEKIIDQINQEIQLLKEDIENLDNESFTAKITVTKTDAETVKELKVRRTELASQKRKPFSAQQENKEKEMKQLNEEIQNLLGEINSPKPQTEWSREPWEGLPLRVRQARNVLADEKKTTERKRTEMNQFCDEVDRLVKEIYYPKPQMQWSKEPDKEPVLSVREARKAIAEDKKLTQRRNKAEDHLQQEIQLLKEDIENLDDENYTPQLTNSDSEHVKKLGFLRKRLADRKEKLLSSSKRRDDDGNMYVPGRLATTDTASGMSKTSFDDDMYVSGRQAPKS